MEMKRVILSMTTVAALSSLVMAGGDIVPTAVSTPDNSGFYFGIGYSAASAKLDNFVEETSIGDNAWDVVMDSHENAGLGIIGYTINDWIGVEARYTHFGLKADFSGTVLGNDVDIDATLRGDNIGVYLKPQYSFGDITAYALLGYGWTRLEATAAGYGMAAETDGDFQWGLGASLALSGNTSIFFDYTRLHHGSIKTKYTTFNNGWGTTTTYPLTYDADLDSFNVGFLYRFGGAENKDTQGTAGTGSDGNGFYVGIGYSQLSTDFDFDFSGLIGLIVPDATIDTDESAGLGIIGYRYNEWIGLEARYTHFGMSVDGDDGDGEIAVTGDNLAVYLKPQYGFGDFSVYALLGYGWTKIKLELGNWEASDTHGNFQWGLGASYVLSRTTTFFVDYTKLHHGSGLEIEGVGFDTDVDSYSVGITYTF